MTFFNTKEEVLSFELTKYGRELLSKGELKPAYYSFSDDDVLYDSNKGSCHGGFSEENSDIKNRILDNTPRIRPIPSLKVESEYSSMLGHEDYGKHKAAMIGTISDDNVLKSPTWKMTMLDGEVSSFTESSNTIQLVDCIMHYSMSLEHVDNNKSFDEDYTLLPVANDGTFVSIEKEDFLLHLEENNTENVKEAYEVEVYLYDHNEDAYNQLYFLANNTNMIDGYYVEGQRDDIEISPEHVEYYFNALFDREIPDEDICKGLRVVKSENIYLDYDIECPERDDFETAINIYGSDVEDLEEC